MSFMIPKKPQILYSPMLATFGGGSARGFNPGGAGVVPLEFQFFTSSSVGDSTQTISDVEAQDIGYFMIAGGGSGGASHYPGGGAGYIVYGTTSHAGGDITVTVPGRSGVLLNNGTQNFGGWTPSAQNMGGAFGCNAKIVFSGSTSTSYGGGAGGGNYMANSTTFFSGFGVNSSKSGAALSNYLSTYFTFDGNKWEITGSETVAFGDAGARGSSGGGGAANGGSYGGNGGSAGSDGVNGATYNGGDGMGTSAFSSAISSLQTSIRTYSSNSSATVTSGSAGNKSGGSHEGGGGGGGILLSNVTESSSNPSASASAKSGGGTGGTGYGAGGGASGYDGTRGPTGEGAQGFVALWGV